MLNNYYDAHTIERWKSYYGAWRRKGLYASLLDKMKIEPGMTILDVGCSMGPLFLLPNYPDDLHLIGIDNSVKASKLANKIGKGLHETKGVAAHVLRASAEQIPLRDGSVDRIIDSYCLQFTDEDKTVQTVQGYLRILRSDGLISFSVHQLYHSRIQRLKQVFGKKLCSVDAIPDTWILNKS